MVIYIFVLVFAVVFDLVEQLIHVLRAQVYSDFLFLSHIQNVEDVFIAFNTRLKHL